MRFHLNLMKRMTSTNASMDQPSINDVLVEIRKMNKSLSDKYDNIFPIDQQMVEKIDNLTKSEPFLKIIDNCIDMKDKKFEAAISKIERKIGFT